MSRELDVSAPQNGGGNVWIDAERDRYIDERVRLVKRDQAERIPCGRCLGSAHWQCGCDGTQTVAERIADIDLELEILDK